tara:strand:- start:823 stop:1716 length:894 start_codon:yes stop_codon:yes gene_type:complete
MPPKKKKLKVKQKDGSYLSVSEHKKKKKAEEDDDNKPIVFKNKPKAKPKEDKPKAKQLSQAELNKIMNKPKAKPKEDKKKKLIKKAKPKAEAKAVKAKPKAKPKADKPKESVAQKARREATERNAKAKAKAKPKAEPKAVKAKPKAKPKANVSDKKYMGAYTDYHDDGGDEDYSVVSKSDADYYKKYKYAFREDQNERGYDGYSGDHSLMFKLQSKLFKPHETKMKNDAKKSLSAFRASGSRDKSVAGYEKFIREQDALDPKTIAEKARNEAYMIKSNAEMDALRRNPDSLFYSLNY